MSADDDILALLRAVPNLNVWDGYVTTDEEAKVIDVPLPYVVFYSTPGYDNDERKSGDVGGRVLQFILTGVGGTREQAKGALEKARGAVSRKRLNGSLIMREEANLPVARSDDYTRPGGGPLFFGVDRYGVAV